MKQLISFSILCLMHTVAFAQYAPQAGVQGSTAISKSSPLFSGWATGCAIQYGWMDIADKSQGVVNSGDHVMAIGKPDNGTVSIGDSGVAVLTFSHPIYNGVGADFAVFENGFSNPANTEEAFLEFAFVEVSSDGENFFRFPASCNINTASQIPMAGVYSDARLVNNLAGKYVANYGTPFDLQELAGTAGLDINKVTHVRLVDVVGSVGANGSLDKEGKIINDPYPTLIPTGGFDLDAVGALHMVGVSPASVGDIEEQTFTIFPNPVNDKCTISFNNNAPFEIALVDISGKILYKNSVNSNSITLDLVPYKQGVYYILLGDTNGNKWVEKVTRL